MGKIYIWLYYNYLPVKALGYAFISVWSIYVRE